MEEIKINAIVLNSKDYKEKDKLITLFSVELGKVGALLKGVNNNKAKLKMAGQPFVFGEWELVKNGNFFTIKTVSIIDTFFDLTLDYDKYLLCSNMLIICNRILKENQPNEALFILLLNTLKIIVYEECNYNIVYIKFILSVLQNIGYELNFERCSNCGNLFIGDICLDEESFKCYNCSYEKDVISKQNFSIIKLISNCSNEKLNTLKFQSVSIENVKCIVNKLISNRLQINI